MKKKYFIISDVHGEYDAMVSALKKAGYEHSNPEHQIISLGDNFDRGKKSKEIFDFLIAENAVMIKGNHEEMLENILKEDQVSHLTLFNIAVNGTSQTIESFFSTVGFKFSETTIQDDFVKAKYNFKKTEYGINLLNKLREMPFYFETKNYIFVHAGIDINLENWKESSKDIFTWDVKDSHLPHKVKDKVVIFGHHHSFKVARNAFQDGIPFVVPEEEMTIEGISNYQGQEEFYKTYGPVYIYKDNKLNKIGIDACTNLSNTVNILVLEDEGMEDTNV